MSRPSRVSRRKAAPAVSAVEPRIALDRATIVEAAFRVLDEVGIGGLSTRRIADHLGVKSASLYWHFKDKDELLNEMSGAMFESCLPSPNMDGQDFDWVEWLADGARAIRRSALSRRDGAQIMARPRPRMPNQKINFEHNVKTVMRSGLTDLESRLTMQTLRRFAIGAALQEQATPGAKSGYVVLGGEEGFEFGLQTFIDGLKARLADRRKSRLTAQKKR